MKYIFTTSLLSTKIFALMCAGMMGLGVWTAEASDTGDHHMNPCHSEETVSHGHPLCDMCEMALDAWDQDMILPDEIVVAEVSLSAPNYIALPTDIALNSTWKSDYQAYNPPPEITVNTAIPNTKTTILLI